MARIRWLVCAVTLTCAMPVWGAPQLPPSVPRIRPLGEHATLVVQRGIAHSQTFRELAAHLERSDVVVYVSISPRTPGRCPGATRFIASTRYLRFLHVALDSELPPKEMVALLGHELQHALEVAEAPDIQDIGSFRRYYQQHGFESGRAGVFDSRAARETGRRVRAELASAPTDLGYGG